MRQTTVTATPVEERSERLHRYAGRLLASLDDVTCAGVRGVPVATLNAAETAETVLELGTVIARLEGCGWRCWPTARTSTWPATCRVRSRPTSPDG